MTDLFWLMLVCNTLAIACNCVGLWLVAEWIRRAGK